jgi:hypothetical protein
MASTRSQGNAASSTLGYLDASAAKTKWKKLEEKLYGEPAYKWIHRQKRGKKSLTLQS